MKALPLNQPWATLVATGAKSIETRAYPPRRVGLHPGQRIAIYATKGLPPGGNRAFGWLCAAEPFREALVHAGMADWWWQSGSRQLGGVLASVLPRGAIVCTCKLAAAEEMTPESIEAVSDRERDFGLYEPGRWAWTLSDVDRLEPPPAATTRHQGVFTWPPASTKSEGAQGRLL